MAVQNPPEGFTTVTPYLTIRNVPEALEFYQKAFGATTLFTMPMPDGKIVHAEMKIGNAIIMMSEENPDWGSLSPLSLGGNGSSIMLYVPDCDAVHAQAIAAGATEYMPQTDQFWGDRYGMVKDPYGHSWSIATHKEDVSPEEMAKRMEAAFSAPA